MPCTPTPSIPLPPGIDLLLPELTFSVPSLPAAGITICCSFELPPIPGFPIVLPLGTFLVLLGAAADAVLALVDAAIDLLNSLLDQIPPINCPFD